MSSTNSTKQQTTNTTTLPQWQLQAYQNMGSQATGLTTDPTTGLPNSLPALKETANESPYFNNYLNNASNAVNVGDNLSNANAFNGFSSNVSAPSIGNNLSGFNSNISAAPVSTSGWNSDTANQYMSPYIGSVLNTQQQLANQQFGQQLAGENMSAAASGAVGGDRSAINQGTMRNDFNLQQQNLQANALNAAYSNAQGAFNNDANRQLQAGVENSQLGLAANTQNANLNFGALNAGNQVNMLNASLGFQASNANNNANLAAMSGTNALNAQAAQNTLQGVQLGQGAGLASQQYQQQQMDNQYANAMNQYLFPEQQLQWQEGIYAGMPDMSIHQGDYYTQQTTGAMSNFMGILSAAAKGAATGMMMSSGGLVKG